MSKLKYTLILILFLAMSYRAEALNIEYGSIIGTKGSNLLVQYYGIEKKQNFLCNILTHGCEKTKKVTLGIVSQSSIKKSLQNELEDKHANHITLSPSGKLLAYYIDGTDATPTRTFTLRDMKSTEEFKVSSSVSYWDLVADEGRVFAFSSDSGKLSYLDDRDGVLALYLVDTTKLTGGEIVSTKLTTSAYQIDDFLWSGNNTIYYVGNSIDNPYLWSLYRYNLKTGKDVVLETGVSYTDKLRLVGSTIIFNRLQKYGYGPEMYSITNKKVQQFSIPGISNKRSVANQEVVKAGNINAVLMRPTEEDTSKTYPLVIWLHGGPYRQTSYGYHPFHSYGIYDSMLELLRKNGVVVLKLDYRGSFGFGRSYAEGIKGSVGKGDVEDVMSAIAYAKNRYHISNVYLAGNSYGGYLSLRTLVDHPEALTGVISINGVTDWESLLVKMKTSIFNTEFSGLPDFNNRALYDQASIFNKIGNIGNQKVEVIAGIADRTIPIWQATDLYDKLKEQNKNVSIVQYPGEDHVYKEKKTITDLCKQLFNFVGMTPDKDCSS